MASYEDYIRKGYDPATAEAYALEDEAAPAPKSPYGPPPPLSPYGPPPVPGHPPPPLPPPATGIDAGLSSPYGPPPLPPPVRSRDAPFDVPTPWGAPAGEWPSSTASWSDFPKPPSPPPPPLRGIDPDAARFTDVKRMAQTEKDEEALIEHRVRSYREGQPLVKPDKVSDFGGSRLLLYSGDGAREMRRRKAAVEKIRGGGRK